MTRTDQTDDPAASGERVLGWLVSGDGDHPGPSAEARAAARRSLQRCGFVPTDDLVDDVVGEAAVAVLRRAGSATPWDVENPAAYGTTVIANVVRHLTRGDHVPLEEASVEAPPPEVDEGMVDDLRVVVEHSEARPWLTSATLAYIVFAMHPAAVPPQAPWPRAGAAPRRALAWPALWAAGQRDLFPGPDGDARAKTRQRRIDDVLDHVERAYRRYLAEQEGIDG